MKAADYQITAPIHLKDRKTHEDFGKKSELEDELDSVSKDIAEIQNAMYAHGNMHIVLLFTTSILAI